MTAARVYRIVFTLAAAYNIAFGLWCALAPRQFFRLFDLAPPLYPSIWSCLGMEVGLYGVAYAYAAWRLDRAFPLIAIGLAGKILGPIGWITSELPFRTIPLIVFDDLLWWIPFALFLLEGRKVAAFFKRTAPFWCAALHVIGAFVAVLFLRNNDDVTMWRAGWMIWMLAAISVLGFYAWWGARVAEKSAVIAFLIACAAIACDFSGESIFISTGAPSRLGDLLTGGAANALYTIAGIVLTLATPSLKPLMRAWAWLAWASGIALTVCTIAGTRTGIVVSSALLMVTFTPWVLFMSKDLE